MTSKTEIAAEVLGLGQTLFDAVIDAASVRPASDEAFPETEVREASEEFFARLRELLLDGAPDG